ncbi:unnamed protein product [Cylicostephanus goldi]|uniref:Uncharacterized protein n=1 Tax=Cylicostephanus goldi TaxID=71465 RepID=A0A3P7MQ79_CYLGO|nr:unnamed protein product [Cylicostephanus goldi]
MRVAGENAVVAACVQTNSFLSDYCLDVVCTVGVIIFRRRYQPSPRSTEEIRSTTVDILSLLICVSIVYNQPIPLTVEAVPTFAPIYRRDPLYYRGYLISIHMRIDCLQPAHSTNCAISIAACLSSHRRPVWDGNRDISCNQLRLKTFGAAKRSFGVAQYICFLKKDANFGVYGFRLQHYPNVIPTWATTWANMLFVKCMTSSPSTM